MKTIKQLADELHISKQALNKKIDNLNCRHQLLKSGNRWLIPESVENTIKNTFATTKSTTNQSTTIDILVDTLTKQLEEKDKQIESLLKTLDQAQQLQAITEQKLKLLEQKPDKPKIKKWWHKKISPEE